jgi:parallel beta-helix repeat protein
MKREHKMKSMKNKNLYKSLPVIFAWVLLILVAQDIFAGQTFTVTNTDDGGAGSLRQAILEANDNPGLDVIAFNISSRSGSPYTIQPTSRLPQISDPVIIDGYTQPGASPNTNGPGQGSNAVLKIELDGSVAGANSVHGLHIIAGGSTVRGMVINRFSGNGIMIFGNEATGNLVQGNFIGTDFTGTVDLGNLTDGVQIRGAANNIIGGIIAEARNVISGNNVRGISIQGDVNMDGRDATGNLVQGNLIGTDVTGTAALGNTHDGVVIRGAANNTIGGASASARNVISGNNTGGGRGGVSIINHPNLHITGASDNLVQGNFIGPDVTGTMALGNGSGGVVIEAAANNTLTDNTISNNVYGIRLQSSSENQIYNNNFIDNTIQAYVTDSEGNIFNLEKPTGGNYWSDWTSPDIDGDGFVDSPYFFTDGMDNLPWSRQDDWPPPAPLPILPDTAITDPSLVAWYRFDGDASDSSANSLHGTEMGDPTYEAGVFGQAISLDGDGDYVDCGLAPEFDITNFITFTYWIKVVEFDRGWNTVLSKGDDSWRSSRAAMNNFMEAAVSGTAGDFTYGVTPVNDGQWHHVGFVYDGKSNYLYVDGEVDATERSTGQINVSSYPLWIGDNSQAPGMFWNGLIDDVMIFNRALRQMEIQVIMQGEKFPYAFNPDPANGAILTDTNVTLSWSSGSGSQLHIVYFGDNFEDVNNDAGGLLLEATTYTPGLLESNKVYYWRVDEYDGAVIHKGDVWSFTVADPLSEALDTDLN